MAAFRMIPGLWYVILILAILVFAIVVVKGYLKKLSHGCCGSGDAEQVSRVRVGDKNKSHYPHEALLTIDGMVCSSCARRVENALNQLEGVWATVDVSAKQAKVRMKEPVAEQTLRDTVNHIGAYTVMSVQQVR